MAAPDTLTDRRVATTLGPYRVHRVLGRGGMGTVYLATHRRLKRKIALKVLEVDPGTPPDTIERFRREGRMAARLTHPGIAQVYEVGERDDCAYIAMEYVRGSSLRKWIPEGGMEPQIAAHLVQGVAVALEHAHRTGVLHRDLKPSNILVDPLGRPKITDFGLARRMDGSGTFATLTLKGALLGTPAYMSPEQATGEPARVGVASDIYQLGAVLYHLLAGCEPFEGDTPVQVLYRVMNETPVPPRRRNPAVPRPLEKICQKAMEKEPGRRYRSAREMAQDLERYFRGYEVRAAEDVNLGRFVAGIRRHPFRASILVLLASLSLAAGIRLVLRGSGEASAETRTEDLVRESRRAVREKKVASGIELARRAVELGGAPEAAKAARSEALRALELAIESAVEHAASFEDVGDWETAAGLREEVNALERIRDEEDPGAGSSRAARRLPDADLGPFGGLVRYVQPADGGTSVVFLDGSFDLVASRPGAAEAAPVARSGRPLLAATTLPDQRIAAAGLDGLVRFHVPGSDRPGSAWHVGLDRIETLAAAAGSTLAAGGRFGIEIFSGNGEPRARIPPPAGARFLALAWQREEEWLFAADSEGRLHVFDGQGKPVARFGAHARRATALAVDPAGEWLATAGWDGEVHVWKMGEWEAPAPRASIPLGERVSALAVSSSGKTLAVATWGAAVRVYRTESWDLAAELAGSPWGTASLGFSPDENWLAGGGEDGSIRVWRLSDL